MKATMGHFGEATDPSTLSPNIVSAATNLADQSIDRSLAQAESLLKSQEVQAFIEQNGLAPYIQDLTKERVKTFLALFGLWSVYKFIKSPIGLACVGGAALYVMTGNKDKVVAKVADKVGTATVNANIASTATTITSTGESSSEVSKA